MILPFFLQKVRIVFSLYLKSRSHHIWVQPLLTIQSFLSSFFTFVHLHSISLVSCFIYVVACSKVLFSFKCLSSKLANWTKKIVSWLLICRSLTRTSPTGFLKLESRRQIRWILKTLQCGQIKIISSLCCRIYKFVEEEDVESLNLGKL